MTTEENKRMLALSYIVADLKAENVELEQRVHQLVDDYNKVVHQLNSKKERKKEDPSKQMLGEMRQMRDHCDKLELENVQQKKYVKAIDSFMKEKELYMSKGVSCSYVPGHSAVCSTVCLECDSCLSVLDGCGVICRQVLEGLKIGSSEGGEK